MNYFSRKKGFTLIEFLVASVIFGFLSMAAGGLFYIHGKLINNMLTNSREIFDAQGVAQHISENIQDSAWVKILSSSDIELHSQSNPAIRRYTLNNNGTLTYNDGVSPPKPLAINIQANNLFTGLGMEKSDNRFQRIAIEFWASKKGEKGPVYLEKDLSYINTVAVSRESWDIIYVNSTKTNSLEEGTKINPYLDIQSAANSISGEYPDYSEILMVETGEYNIKERVIILQSRFIYFSEDAKLTIEPGATILLGNNTTLSIYGEFDCEGNPNKIISIDTLHPEDPTKSWWCINIKTKQNDLKISYTDITGGGVPYAGASTTAVNVYASSSNSSLTMNNCFIHDMFYQCAISSFKYIDLHDNYFQDSQGQGGYGIGIGYPMLTPLEDGTIWRIYKNTFDAVEFPLELSMSGSAGTASAEISNNNFLNISQGYGIGFQLGPIDDQQTQSGNNTILIDNNYFLLTGLGAATGICIDKYASDTNPLSGVIVKNNTIDVNGGNGITVNGNKSHTVISNNDIRNTFNNATNTWSSGIGISASSNLEVINNIIHNDTTSSRFTNIIGGSLASENPSGVTCNNNVFYGKGNLLIGTQYNATNLTFLNNTISGPAVQIGILQPGAQIVNSIIWGTSSLDDSLKQYFSYSDVRGMTADPAKGIISQDPLFTNQAGNVYTLQAGSPCIGQGGPLIKNPDGTRSNMGAYGGPGQAGWVDGAGVKK